MDRRGRAYTLYQTLNSNIKKTNMTAAQEKELVETLENIEDSSSKEAVVKLIAEHYRLSGGSFDIKKPILPYGGKQNGPDTTFDLGLFPTALKWILWKFVQI